jgi:hypothetical protein
MSTPLRLNNQLLTEAREAGTRFHRSITQQIEHWAQLGRAVEATLSFSSSGRLKDLSRIPDLGKLLARPQTRAGKRRALALIHSSQPPAYSADPDDPTGVIRHHPGKRPVRGRFVNRVFIPRGKR